MVLQKFCLKTLVSNQKMNFFSVRPCAIQRMVYLKYNNLDELWYLHERQEYRQAVRNLDTLFAGCKFDFGKFVKTIATLLGKKLGLKLCVFLGLDKFEGIPISEVLAEEAKVNWDKKFV